MKVYASGLDANKPLDAYFKEHFFVIPKGITLVKDIADADCVFICLSLSPKFILDTKEVESLKASGKPVVVFDYTEFGDGSYRGKKEYDLFMHGHRVFGYDYCNIGKMMQYPQYKKLFVAITSIKSNIRCYFMREYSSEYDYAQCGFPVYPCDYVLNNLNAELYSKEQYEDRPVSITFIGGAGTIPRTRMIGKIYIWAANNKYHVVSSKAQYDYFTKRGVKKLVALFHIEGGLDERIDFRPVYSNSKIVIDIAGSGIKCVRNAESAMYAASTKQISGLKFSYDWIDEVNCIELDVDNTTNELRFDKIIPKLDNYIAKNNLYDMYKLGYENACKYQSKYYMKNYVLATVEKHL